MTTIKVPSLADVKRRIKEEKENTTTRKNTVDKNFFPFWQMEEDSEIRVRILPDINPDNPFGYYRTKFSHQIDVGENSYRVTCPKTFPPGKTADCPICDRSQKFYRDEGKESKNGKYYWRGTDNVVRLLVLDSNLNVEDEDGNAIDYNGTVVTSQFGKQIMKAIDEQIAQLDEDVDPTPWGLDNGFDFIIKKTKSGSHAKYDFSYFAKHPSPVPEKYMKVVEENLIDLNTLLPEQPSLEKVQHFLDAHDGVVELNLAAFNSSNDDNSDASPEKSKVDAPEQSSEKTVEPKVETPEKSVADDDSGDDDDLINSIINRGA